MRIYASIYVYYFLKNGNLSVSRIGIQVHGCNVNRYINHVMSGFGKPEHDLFWKFLSPTMSWSCVLFHHGYRYPMVFQEKWSHTKHHYSQAILTPFINSVVVIDSIRLTNLYHTAHNIVPIRNAGSTGTMLRNLFWPKEWPFFTSDILCFHCQISSIALVETYNRLEYIMFQVNLAEFEMIRILGSFNYMNIHHKIQKSIILIK